MNNKLKPVIFCLVFWTVAGIASCAYCQDQQLGQWPRVVPRTFTFSQVFPVGNKDFVRNAFVKVVSGAESQDTSVFFIDYYGNAQKVVKGSGGNGIYGGSGIVPVETVSTVTDNIVFDGIGDYDLGANHAFRIQTTGNEPGIMSLVANGDSLVFDRSDTEFIIKTPDAPLYIAAGGENSSLTLQSTDGKVDLSAARSVNITSADSVIIGNAIFRNVGTDFFLRNTGVTGNIFTDFSLGQDATGITTLNGSRVDIAANATTKITVNSTGVGIGTTPLVAFHTTGTNRLAGVMQIQASGSTYRFFNSNDPVNVGFEQSNVGVSTVGGASLNFRTSSTARGSITSAGLWAIGNITPTQGLDIGVNMRNRLLIIQDYETQTGAGSANASATVSANLYNPGADQASVTYFLPSSPTDGQICQVTFYVNVTTLTVDPGATGEIGVFPTTAVEGDTFTFKFFSGVGGWSTVAKSN